MDHDQRLPKLAILHNIFLNREQRYKIGEFLNVEVHTVGVAVPVWYCPRRRKGRITIATNEPAEEIVCKYTISNLAAPQVVDVFPDGYCIHLPQNTAKKMLDVQDRGAEEISFRHYSAIKLIDTLYRVIHYVNIKDIAELTETLSI